MKKPSIKKPPIKKVADVQRPRSWAIYGRSGSGKTTLAASFPKPLLLLDIRDQGTDSISDVKGVDVWEIEDWEDFEDVYEYLTGNAGGYKTIVFDTVTQMQVLCLEHILFKKRKDTNRIGDWGSMTRREWGDASASMKEKITDFRNLNLELVFIAQEKAVAGEDDENDQSQLLVPEVGPSAMKSVAAHLNASVSIIGHSFVRLRKFKQKVKGKDVEMEEPVHCLRLGANPIFVTKTRKPKDIEIPQYVEDPSYKDIIEVLKGN
jgi:AAA domain